MQGTPENAAAYQRNPHRIASFLVLLVSVFLCFLCSGCTPTNHATTPDTSQGTAEHDAGSAIQIPQYISKTDTDGDGIDDQTDILEGAKAYIATKPIYESKYYAGGYPNDGHGVCTDVVAQALLHAGFDLKALLSADVKAHPTDYAIEQPDPNIDFRRVPNQNVYFKRHARSLTTDLSEIEAWQGGDIVVFQRHIGIVSDRRNQNGIPYLIHHYSKLQTNYEQDTLSKWGKVVGHYRMSE